MKLRKIANNQTVIETNAKRILISYETPVAVQYISNGKFVRTSKPWSATTSKHINSWLNGADFELEPQEYFDKLLDSVNA